MSDASPSFEHRLEELAEITAALEQGSLGLDESLLRFERGVGLLRECREMLDNVERRVEVLTGFDADGRPVTRPFEASATFESPGGKAPTSGTDEGKVTRRRAPKKAAGDEQTRPESPSDEAREAGPSLF